MVPIGNNSNKWEEGTCNKGGCQRMPSSDKYIFLGLPKRLNNLDIAF